MQWFKSLMDMNDLDYECALARVAEARRMRAATVAYERQMLRATGMTYLHELARADYERKLRSAG